jgi:hypothetical protein
MAGTEKKKTGFEALAKSSMYPQGKDHFLVVFPERFLYRRAVLV